MTDESLVLARELGAEAVIDARQTDAAEQVVDRTRGGVHGVLVTAVSRSAFGQALRMVLVRAQHGGSCYRVGRCRLPNSYLYDAEIIPRVQLYLREDGRFGDTSVWVLGERRLVTLMGCVQSQEQAEAMEKAVGLVDDVMGVVNLLQVGTARDTARYPVAGP